MGEYQIVVPEGACLDVETLGPCEFKSPLPDHFIGDDERIVLSSVKSRLMEYIKEGKDIPSFERAGPREKIYFDPRWTKAAIVTCGGLCPGLNDVIRGIVMTLFYIYGVKAPVLGIRYGYRGLNPEVAEGPIELTPDAVKSIHNFGGTILGSSRGAQDISMMVNTLVRQNVNVLFCIGGDGTIKGAHEIAKYILKRGLKISIIAVPKTIDNDIPFVEKTFGYNTAVHQAAPVISSAHTEALGALNGVGLIKLMGRESGWIAARSTLALVDVNFVLVPEQPFSLEKFLEVLIDRLQHRKHAVVVVAEGAGQNLINSTVGDDKGENKAKDASGNLIFNDIGIFLKERIAAYAKEKKFPVTVKYIDPSYMIRSSAATSSDSVFCWQLAQSAVHAAMAGKTDTLVGSWNEFFTHVPIELATKGRKKIDVNSAFWNSVLEATGQPEMM